MEQLALAESLPQLSMDKLAKSFPSSLPCANKLFVAASSWSQMLGGQVNTKTPHLWRWDVGVLGKLFPWLY